MSSLESSKVFTHWISAATLPGLLIFQLGCDRNKSFDFLSSFDGSNGECGISAFSPQSSTIRAPSGAAGKTTVSVSPTDESCSIEYYLNGVKLSQLSGTLADIPSSSLAAGTNTFQARVVGTKLSTTLPTSKTWTLVRNSAPVCGTQTPSANGNSTGMGGRFDMSAPLSDSDGDALTVSWFINGIPAGNAITSEIASNVLVGSIVTTEEQAGDLTLKALVSDNLDSAECVWRLAVNDQCAFATFSPTPNPTTQEVRAPALGSSQTQFVAVSNAAACTVSWLLNGTPIGSPGTVLPLLSSNLNSGVNTLRAITSDGQTSAIREWSVRKNTPPTCASQTPASTGITYALGSTNLLTAQASDTENDTLTWAWTLNNSAAPAGVLTAVASNLTSFATFNPISGSVSTGLNNIVATLNDGYDTGSCSWSIQVAPACSLVSTNPSGSTVKASSSPTRSSTFSVTASDSGCPVTWTLNGAPLAGTSANQVVQSSALNPGGNVLVAETGSSSKTWYVSKNIPPSCGSQTPATTGYILGVGVASSFQIVPSDVDDTTGPFTFSWKLNGLAPPAQMSTSTNAASTTATANYTPIISQVGNNVISVDVDDSYDTTTCTWQSSVLPNCAVTSTNPSSSTLKVAQAGSNSSTFVIGVNDSSCSIEWKINEGNVISSAAAVNILSSQLNSGENTITARVYNSMSSSTRTWTVTKNVAPTCAGQSPAATGSVFGVGDSLNFIATAGNTDSDSLTYAWTVNGNTVPGAILSVTSPSASVSEGLFNPSSSYVGSNTINTNINDGFDSATCSWSVTVRPACSLLSAIPNSASTRLADASGTSETFGVVPNDASCIVNWSLNSTQIASNSQFLSLLSDQLNSGENELVATASNGSSTATRTWTVSRNRPPVCALQTPSNAGVLNIDVGVANNLSAVITDQDLDTFTMAWSLNSISTPSFDNILANPLTNTYSARFTPAANQVGAGQILSTAANDGYDTTICSWAANINDPNTVNIQSCLPVENPVVVKSAGTDSSRTLTVLASGTGLTYQWYLDSFELTGQTAPALSVSASTLTVGNHTLEVKVRDAYSNEASCNYTIKRNSPPQLSLPLPSSASLFRVNYAKTVPMSITAIDSNLDALTYSWFMNGTPNGTYLPTDFSTTTFDPGSNTSALGVHTLRVDVNDGHETSSYSWNIQVTAFTDTCNTIMNGSATGAGATGGKICTLVGYPGIGSDLDPITADPSTLRMYATNMIEDELNNLIFTDDANHVVWYFNKLPYAVDKFGTNIPSGKLKVILGAGYAGNTNPTNSVAGGSSGLTYKLNNPIGIAYDMEDKVLYLADTSNHRVIYLTDTTNYPQLFLGNGATSPDNSSTNGENTLGSSHICPNPRGLAIHGSGANRKLYTTCYDGGWHNSIKVANANIDDVSNFSKTDLLVGRMATTTLNGNVYNSTTRPVSGFSNGTIGRNGDAEIIAPTDLTIDPLGRLYVFEWQGNAPYPVSRTYQSTRIKVINTGTTALTAFPSGSLTFGDNIFVDDITTSAPTSILGQGQVWNGSSYVNVGFTATNSTLLAAPVAASHNFNITGPSHIRVGACLPYVITPRFNTAAGRLAAAATVVLTAPYAGANLYSDASCTSAVSTLNLATGTPFAIVYIQASSAGTGTLTAAAAGFTSGSLSVSGVASGTSHNTLRVSSPTSFVYNTCVPFVIQAFNGNTPQTVGSNRTIRLLSNGVQSFYTDSSCATNPIYRTTLAAGTGEIVLYMDRKVNIQPGHAGVLIGSVRTDPNTGGNRFNYGIPTTTGIPDGQSFQDGTGNISTVEIDWNASTNSLRGLFLSSPAAHRIHYLNLSGSTLALGNYLGSPVTIGNNDVWIVHNQSGVAGYILGDNGPTSRSWGPTHIQASNDRSKIYIADRNNGRIVSADISSFGSGGGSTAFGATAVLGAGFLRSLTGAYIDSDTPAPDVRLNRPYQATVDSTAQVLYFTDTVNCRVRSLNLVTGMVETVLSRGCGDQFAATQGSLSYARDVKDVAVAIAGGVKWLLFSDNNNHGNNTTNTMSMVRAFNLGSSSGSIYGLAINGKEVATVAGDYVKGTGAWNTGTFLNTNGMNARDARLFNPDGLAFDSTTGATYIGLRSDHCIIKLNADGTIQQMINNCTVTAPSVPVDGPARDINSNPIANVRHPGSIEMDPAYPGSGNFFFTDFLDTGSARLRYVNFLPDSVPFGNVSVAGGSALNPQVTTIFTYPSPGMSGYTTGLAVFDRQICISSGLWGDQWSNSVPNNVQCKDRYQIPFASNTSLFVGSDPAVSSLRGAGPMGTEQEGVYAYSASLNGPTGLAFDDQGNLYIVEAGNHIIRFVRRWWP